MTDAANSLLMSLQQVGVAYRRRYGFVRHRLLWAIRDVSFDLYRGETLGVIGRNGVGKSTLLKLMAGVIEPDEGRIQVNGVRAALLTLQAGFDSNLTGRENAVLSGLLLGMSRQALRRQMDEILEFAGLQDAADELVGTYSNGMKARLGFSVAMLADPDVLLVDEVLGVGDADFREKSGQVLRERIDSDRTVVLVSHNGNVIRKHCDRAVWIENGLVVAVGTASAVLDQYDTRTRGNG